MRLFEGLCRSLMESSLLREVLEFFTVHCDIAVDVVKKDINFFKQCFAEFSVKFIAMIQSAHPTKN